MGHIRSPRLLVLNLLVLIRDRLPLRPTKFLEKGSSILSFLSYPIGPKRVLREIGGKSVCLVPHVSRTACRVVEVQRPSVPYFLTSYSIRFIDVSVGMRSARGFEPSALKRLCDMDVALDAPETWNLDRKNGDFQCQIVATSTFWQ